MSGRFPWRLSSNDSAPPRARGDWVVVGRVGRPHGLGGSFFVEQASEDSERFSVGATLYADERPLRVVEAKRAGGRPVIRLEQAVERGTSLAVRRRDLPPPAPDAFYAVDLVGLAVEEEGGRALGRVSDVAAGVANDVLELDSGRALPLVEDCVRTVDLDHGRIVVAPGFADPE